MCMKLNDIFYSELCKVFILFLKSFLLYNMNIRRKWLNTELIIDSLGITEIIVLKFKNEICFENNLSYSFLNSFNVMKFNVFANNDVHLITQHMISS